MKTALILAILFASSALAENETSAVPPAVVEPSGEYEIDYEEEPDAGVEVEETETAEDAPTPKAGRSAPKRLIGGGGPAVQGTHSKNRFAPILKSETRSVYKKDGKLLDVDTD